MPHFFDTKNLTQQQLNNWDSAVEKYKAIQEKNKDRTFLSMSEAEKEALKVNSNLKTDEDIKQRLNDFHMSNYGDEKSALFARLLEGKKPLRYAPPSSFSYPWYSVLESDEPIQLIMLRDMFSLSDMIEDNTINLHQNNWEVLEVISDTQALLTYRGWKELGMVWKISLQEINCRDTNSAIIPHHNPELGRITTLAQLEAEQLFQANIRFNHILIAQDERLFDAALLSSIEKYGKGFGVSLAKNDRLKGQRLIQERSQQNLPAFPTQEEIAREVEAAVQFYLDGDIVVKDQELYQKTWILEKFKFIDNIYDEDIQ